MTSTLNTEGESIPTSRTPPVALDGNCVCAPAGSPCTGTYDAPAPDERRMPSTLVGGTPAVVGMAVAASAEHAFKHSGCCASGWLRESVCTDAVAACAARCLANTNCQFFSHQLECSNVGTNCALCVAGSCSQVDVNGPRTTAHTAWREQRIGSSQPRCRRCAMPHPKSEVRGAHQHARPGAEDGHPTAKFVVSK